VNKIFSSLKNKLSRKDGMTLVEVLVAMSILMLIIFTFTPLFANYYRNIYKAGEVTKNTYNKASIMERLFANRDGSNNAAYDTEVNNVPLELFAKTEAGTTVSSITFGTTGSDVGTVNGRLITTDGSKHGGTNEYASFYASNAGNDMVCFPKALTDDFIETKVMVLPIGFTFKKNFSENLFTVKYTNQNGERVGADQTPTYYDVEIIGTGEDAYAEFTFKGANDVICFQNSPLEIYYSGDGGHTVLVEIGAPEIIMVGEQTQDGKYFYYATAGVDVNTGHIDLIAKDMKSTTDNAADLNAAMNDVEWVEPGEGYIMGSGNTKSPNPYGYYIMGGDNGQIRRFWRNETTGNYYWDGDYVVDFAMYTQEGSVKNIKHEEKKMTQVSYESFYTADYTGSNLVMLNQYKWKFGIGFLAWENFWSLYAGNFGTVTSKTTSGISPQFYVTSTTRGRKDKKELYDLPQYQTFSNETPIESYKRMMKQDSELTTPITITSVGSVALNSSDKSYYLHANPKAGVAFDYNDHGTATGIEAYPQQSYSLYCGVIPAFLDLFGRHEDKSIGGKVWGKTYLATLGIGYANGKYGVTGKFADIGSPDMTVVNQNDPDDSVTYKWFDTLRAFKSPSGQYSSSATTIPAGSLFSNYGQVGDGVIDAGITSHKVIDISIGYLSWPFANSERCLQVPGGDNTGGYLKNDSYNHGLWSAAPREFSTFLDIASYHDDVMDASYSIAVGYALGIMAIDSSAYTRIGHLRDMGIIYLRASDEGNDYKSEANQCSGGAGYTLAKESNIFHHFYGIDMHIDGQKKQSCQGWYNKYHYQDLNENIFPGDQGGNYYAQITDDYSHVLEQTECTTCACGMDQNSNAEFMVGTANGTVLGWTYDYSKKTDSSNQIWNAMRKEFENYTWAEKEVLFGLVDVYKPKFCKGGNSDYWSVYGADSPTLETQTGNEYSFISSLSRINDIKFGDDYWVVAGNQGTRNPKDCYGALMTLANNKIKSFSDGGGAGSYVNVRYYRDGGSKGTIPAWKAVKVTETENVNFTSIEYCQGIWYAVGYIDLNTNGVNDADDQGVIYYATNPLESAYDDTATGGSYNVNTYNGGWRRCITSQGVDENGNPIYTNDGAENTYVLYYKGGSCVTRTLTGVNSAASQG